jgi:hypothetical protein
MRLQAILALAACALLAAGCAPLEPRNNNIAIETVSGNALVTDATCRVSNGSAVWTIRTPAMVPAGGGAGDLQVSCEKPGYRASDVVFQGGYVPSGSSISLGLGASSGGWRRSGFGFGLGMTQPLGRPYGSYPSRIVVEMTPL